MRDSAIQPFQTGNGFALLARADWATIFEHVPTVPKVDVKFGELVPEAEMASYARERTYDPAGAKHVVARGMRTVDREN